MQVVADEALAARLAECLHVHEDTVRKEECSWPVVAPTVLAFRSFSSPLLVQLIRISLGNAEKFMRLALVREEWTEEDLQRIERTVQTQYAYAHSTNDAAIDRISTLRDCEWKHQQMEQLMKWKTIPAIQYSTFSLNQSLRGAVDQYFAEDGVNVMEPEDEISKKAPILHWTPHALEGDLEIAIRVTFPLCLPERRLLSDLSSIVAPYAVSPYHWSDGLLISHDSVRVHIQRVSANQIEVAGRICYEELEDLSSACRPVWRLLSYMLEQVLSLLARHPHLHFHSDILLVGRPLFSPPIDGRMFALTKFMTTAHVFHKVGFRVNDIVYDVNIPLLFPNRPPANPDDLWQLGQLPPAIRCPPPRESPTPPCTLGVHPANRGRRVSFGAIRLMDSNGTVEGYVDGMVQQTMDTLIHT